ncbi:MAG: helix-turn-helix domain-containing protein [Desulfatitalea sp.]|nr:helix-turn-helix domain-containing protein [Desulfatitalea sp.]MBI5897310.1 helix-turn-helix domain-containing protein [Desulfobacterales bacterium]
MSNDDAYIHMPLLTVSEAAREMGVGKKIIYQMIENEAIRAVKDHGALLVEKRSLDRFRGNGKMP